MSVNILTYLHAHVLKSTEAAVCLAEKNPEHKQFAQDLIRGKQAAAESKLQKINMELPRQETQLKANRATYRSAIAYVNAGLHEDAPHSQSAQRQRTEHLENVGQYIERPKEDIANLRIDQNILQARVSKYTELTSRLDQVVQTQLQRDLHKR